MSLLLQFALPFGTALLVLLVFQVVAHLHIQLSEVDAGEEDDEFRHIAQL